MRTKTEKTRFIEVNLEKYMELTEQTSLTLLNNIKIMFWTYNIKSREMICTEGAEEIYGCSVQEFVSGNLWKEVMENYKKKVPNSKKKKSAKFEYKIIGKRDGKERWLQTDIKPIFNYKNELIGYSGCTNDITEKRKSSIELEESEKKYRELFEHYALGIYIYQDDSFKLVNSMFSELTGYSKQELLKMDWRKLVNEEGIKLAIKRLKISFSGKKNCAEEITLVHKNGTEIKAELHSTMISYNGKPALIGTLLDISEKVKSKEMVDYLAYYDTLTGAPNRNLFYRKIEEELTICKKEKSKFALMFLDLDQFKAINDTFGHQVGDSLLKNVSDIIKGIVGTKGFLARIGGDEFVVLLRYKNIRDVLNMAKSITEEVPKNLKNEFTTIPTIGISLYPKHGSDIETLIRCADIAMYNSKQNENRDENYVFFNEEMDKNIYRMNKLIKDLKLALKNDHLYLVYQPKLKLSTREIVGVEALLRWNHPELGEISPQEFIPLAEKSGLIVAIGDWVIEKAIEDIKGLNKKVGLSLNLNINISARQLLKDNLISNVKNILERMEFQAELLNFEITESVALYDIEKTVEMINRLKKMDIKISLDDFGTGYSSLSYLSQLPIDFLKIDRSFVKDLEKEESKRTIIKAIIDVAHGLKLKVVAEGIENRKQLDILNMYNCEKGQGYYFSKPISIKLLEEFVENHK